MSVIKSSALKKAVQDKHILIDTNIIIYLTDMIEPYASLSRMLFEMIEKGGLSAVLSIITVAEVMQGPLKKGYTRNALDVKNYLMNFPNTVCQEITSDVVGCIGLDPRIDWSQLRTMDSLIIASGIANKAELVLSNDIHFKKALNKDYILAFDV